MNNLFKKIAAATIGAAMAIGMGVAFGRSSSQKAKADEPRTFSLVTSSSELVAGSSYVIATSNDSYAISKTQNGNNRAATAISLDDGILTETIDLEVLTLGGEEGAWTFFATKSNPTGYLFTSNTGKNRLQTTAEDSNDYSKWVITVGQSGTTTIANKGNTVRGEMKYNSENGSSLFSCYQTGENLHLFKEVEQGGEPAPEPQKTGLEISYDGSVKVGEKINGEKLTVKYVYDDGNKEEIEQAQYMNLTFFVKVGNNEVEIGNTQTAMNYEFKESDMPSLTVVVKLGNLSGEFVLTVNAADPEPEPQITPASLVVTYEGANPKVGETLQGEVSVHIKYSDDTVGQEDIAEQCSYYILVNEQEYPVSLETKFEEEGDITIYAKYTPEDAESPIRGSVVITVDEKEVTPDPEPEENKVTIDFEEHSDLTPTVSNTVNGIKFIAAQNNGSATPVLTQANSEQRHSLKLYANNTLTLELPENSSFKSFTSIQCLVTSKNDSTAGQGKYYKDSLESTAVYTHDLQTATFTESEKVNVSGAQKIIISCPLGQYRIAKIDLELSGDAPAPAQTFKVSFEHGEGASGEMDDLAKTEGAVISTAPACTFTAPEGKEFDKWVDSQGNAIVFPYTVNGNVTFVATWKDKVAPVDPEPSEAITCAQALAIVKALDEGATSTSTYKVRGVITSNFAVKESTQTAGTYQFNIADKDSDEEQVVVWWASFKTAPKQGDTVVIEGKLQHFVDQKGTHKYEIVDGTGTIESSTPTPVDPEPVDPEPSEAITCAQALTAAKALDEGATSTNAYKVRGVITTKFVVKESSQVAGTYQFNIADKDSDEEQVVVWWAAFETAPKQGDTVVIEGKLKHHVDQKGTKYEIVDGTGTIESSAPTPVDPEPINPTSISLDKQTASVEVGKTVTLVATLAPAGATGTITWESSDSSVATVVNGVVTGVKAGSATISAKCGSLTPATCVITVTEQQSGGDPEPVDPTPTPVKTIDHIEVSGFNKVSYVIGQELDLSELKVLIYYSDNTFDVATAEQIKVEGYDKDKVGQQVVTVSVGDKTWTVRVVVYQGAVINELGCHGSLIAGSAIISLTSLLGAGLLFFRKKRI